MKTPARAETLEERIRFCVAFTQGTMPLALRVADPAEAGEAKRILAGMRNKAARLVTITIKSEEKPWPSPTATA